MDIPIPGQEEPKSMILEITRVDGIVQGKIRLTDSDGTDLSIAASEVEKNRR